MERRGFVLSVVLILAVAMFASNLNSNNGVTGMQQTTTTTCECMEYHSNQKCKEDAEEDCKKNHEGLKRKYKYDTCRKYASTTTCIGACGTIIVCKDEFIHSCSHTKCVSREAPKEKETFRSFYNN